MQGGSGETSPHFGDERAVSINTISAASKDITDLIQVKDKLQQSIDGYGVV